MERRVRNVLRGVGKMAYGLKFLERRCSCFSQMKN